MRTEKSGKGRAPAAVVMLAIASVMGLPRIAAALFEQEQLCGAAVLGCPVLLTLDGD